METPNDPPVREEPRKLVTFTLRMPVDVHRCIEEAARGSGMSLNQFISDAAEKAANRSGLALLATPVELPVMLAIDLDSFTGRPDINLQALETLATTVVPEGTVGRPVLRSAYCAAFGPELQAMRAQLLQRQVRLEQLASRDSLRLRLAADCVLAMIDLQVRHIVLVTADEDLAFLSSVVEQRGGALHGVGMKSAAATSRGFIQAFRTFRHYETLDKPPQSDDLLKLRRKYAHLLVQIAHRLVLRGTKPVGAAIIPILRDRQPEMSLDVLEMRSFRELAQFALDERLLRTVDWSGTDFMVELSEEGKSLARRLLERDDAASEQRSEVDRVSEAIGQIIGMELPEVSTRFVAFSTAQWYLNKAGGHGINLVDLSYRISERLVDQNTAYRLLNGVYRAGAFDVQSNPANENDPLLLRMRIGAMQFDDAFVLNLMRVRGRFPTQAEPKVISQALYGSPDHAAKVQLMLRVAGDSRYTRSNLQEALNVFRDELG